MKKLLLILLAIVLVSCTLETPANLTQDVQGTAFKGPFLPSSRVSLFVLNTDLNQTGQTFRGNITDKTGSYYIANVPVDGAVELIVEGYFFNEVSGNLSDDVLELKAITAQTGTVNVNLFTTVEMQRVRALVASGLTLSEAKTVALQELASHFHWDLSGTADAIDLESGNGQALLAFSSMVASGRNVSQVGSLITRLTTDFADGTITTEHMDELASSCYTFDATATHDNLQGYFNNEGIAISVPYFGDAVSEFLMYGRPSDYIQTIANNHITTEAVPAPMIWQIGMGSLEKFWLGKDATMSITVNDPLGALMLYNSENTIRVGDTVTAQGDGITVFDIMLGYDGYDGYEFSIDIAVNGETFTNNYIATL